MLKPLGGGQGYLKAGFLGFQKSGKTYTAIQLAIGTRKHFGLSGPIAMFDTESGSDYVAPLVKKQTGVDLVGVKSRAFTDLVATAKECLTAGVSVLVVDSITHPWRELCDAYLVQVNEKRKERKLYALQKLEFQHWAAVKGIWTPQWSDFYLTAPLHIIICGRAGFEYDMETNDETGRKELVKTGIKMRVEGEFGFEPSLLVEMERVQEPTGDGGFRLRRQATVLGDRFGVVDGKTCVDPGFDFFAPHVKLLTPGANVPVDTSMKTETGADEAGDATWQREKRERVILCEEIQGAIVAEYPGQTAEEKRKKGELLHTIFGTRSWTAVENMDSGKLREGLQALRDMLAASRDDGK